MLKKVTAYLIIFTVFTMFAPAMKVMRHFLVNVIYAGSDDDDSTKYEEYDDESDDLGCCGSDSGSSDTTSSSSYNYEEDNSSDDMSCASTDDATRDNYTPTYNTDCIYGTYMCTSTGVINSCNKIGVWVFLKDCKKYGYTSCAKEPACGTDGYGNPIPYCCTY
jgi:hypothetical protein